MKAMIAAMGLLSLLATACDSGTDPAGTPSTPTSTFSPACEAHPRVQVLALDCWGRGTADLPGGVPLDDRILLDAATWTIPVDAGLGTATSVTVSWDGDVARGALAVGGPWAAVAFHSEDRAGLTCPAYTVAVGQDDPWLACTGRAPSLNEAKLFLNGEALYASLYTDLEAATEQIHGATWWWQSNFELIRPDGHPTLSEAARTENTIMTILEGLATVPKRILVARFAGSTAAGLAYVNTDPALRAHARTAGDLFEVISQNNPTPVPLHGGVELVTHPAPFTSRVSDNPALAALDFDPGSGTIEAAAAVMVEGASWHQKVWAIDSRVAYVGGMNIKSTDWDTDAHDPFNARRMKFMSTQEERLAVLERRALADTGPRKDYGIRISGPGAGDVDAILKGRWDLGRATGDLFAEFTTAWDLLEPAASPAGGVLLQVQATQPEPMGERSILESTDKAIRNARDLIYIEDQYFRMPVVLDAFQEALDASPSLRIVVVTKPVSIVDGAKKWTVIMDDALREMAGDRYLLLTMEAYAAGYLLDLEVATPHFAPMDIHSKMLIVDDRYLSVGSCNKNNRGLLIEGEMNVAVLDAAFVREARQRILANATGRIDLDWNRPGAQIAADLDDIAAANDGIRLEAQTSGALPSPPPTGFLYHLEHTTDYLLDVGPDLF
ncbi:MAG: phospholipase D-like domain-containing protein [Pseudomonadota bacterium]